MEEIFESYPNPNPARALDEYAGQQQKHPRKAVMFTSK